jgi:hypothetical protein
MELTQNLTPLGIQVTESDDINERFSKADLERAATRALGIQRAPRRT